MGPTKRTPGCKKGAKSAILTSSMTVELLLVERSIVQSTNTNTNTQEYPEIPESKKDTRKYPTVYFNTPTRPEPDPLPGIFSNTRPDIEKPYPLGTAVSVPCNLQCSVSRYLWALLVSSSPHY